MSAQMNLPRGYQADLVFPPWGGRLPRAGPQGDGSAACGGEQR